MKKALLSVAVMLLVSAPIWAQDAKPNLTGTWTLDTSKSDFGGMPGPDSVVNVIDHKDPQLKITSTQKSQQQGEVTNTRMLTTDGKENTNTMRTMMGDQPVKSTTKWNGKTLTNAFTLDIQGNTIGINEVWAVSDDGKMLTVTRAISTGQGDVTQKFVFNKNP